MISLTFGILIRILSNSYANVFQKKLTNRNEKASIINVYTYLGLTICSVIFFQSPFLTNEIFFNFLIMGILGTLGNYFIIKALSCGELSTLAPINSYKPLVALVFGIVFLGEIPTLSKIFGILLIILGTFLLAKGKLLYNKATVYRFLALVFSGSEAVFIKKLILLTDISTTFFYWALAGLLFSLPFALFSKHKLIIKKENLLLQITLIILVTLMQYTTNYVFSKINVAYALALFQLSTLLSVFLGACIFNEKDIWRKIVATLIMLSGAIIIILF